MAQFMNFPTARERVLTSGNTTIGVIPDICLVSHFQVAAWQVLYRPQETGNIKRWGLPLMIPNFSRLKDGIFREKGVSLPIHGFGRNLPWTATETTGSALSMELRNSDVTRPMYPYEFTFTAKIEAGEGTLTYMLIMENHSAEPMPIAPGFHPYFSIAQADKARLETDGPIGFSVQNFDWIDRTPDNAYPFASPVSIQFPGQGTLHIEELPVHGQHSLRNMQVWTEPPTKPDHAFICFEPTVGSEDALNRPADRLTVESGGSRTIILQLRAEDV
jgi:galactose mutarotase-like enzyme